MMRRRRSAEIVRNDAMDRVLVGLDFFDASINRIAAWVIGGRNFQRVMLFALLQPDQERRRCRIPEISPAGSCFRRKEDSSVQ